MSVLFELAKRVKRGAALLDRRVPNWRRIMRKNEDEFDIANGDCCILGTLEHKNALKKLGKPISRAFDNGYERAEKILRIEGEDYGFNTVDRTDLDADLYDEQADEEEQFAVLQELWRAEFMR